MKWIFFKLMSEAWKDACTSDGNNDISASTTHAIKTFMKQQEAKSRARMASNKAKQTTERKRERSNNGDRENGRDNGNKSKSRWKNNKKHKSSKEKTQTTTQNGKCRRCKHGHLWKDCFYNPRNPNNKLTELSQKSKSSDKESHSHTMQTEPGNHTNATGFITQEKETTSSNKSKCSERHRVSILTDITNTHHIDCFSMHDLKSSQPLESSTHALNASREPTTCLLGSVSKKHNLTRLNSCGTSSKRDAVKDKQHEEELRCLYQAVDDTSEAIFDEDSPLGVEKVNHSSQKLNKDYVNNSHAVRLS